MASDDILWRKVEALKREPASTPKSATRARRKRPKPARPAQAKSNSVPGPLTARKSTLLPNGNEPTMSGKDDTVVSRHHETMAPAVVETIRKTVKQVGKEAATHRFTPEEKQAITDIIYTYRRQGYDTSENEIARIGINWLLWDYQERGHDSVLARVQKALKE